MLDLEFTNQFKKDLKLYKKRGKDVEKLNKVVDLILKEQPLPIKNRNHELKGDYKGHWECHIEPDWLLIYLKFKKSIVLVRTGTHSDLFKK